MEQDRLPSGLAVPLAVGARSGAFSSGMAFPRSRSPEYAVDESDGSGDLLGTKGPPRRFLLQNLLQGGHGIDSRPYVDHDGASFDGISTVDQQHFAECLRHPFDIETINEEGRLSPNPECPCVVETRQHAIRNVRYAVALNFEKTPMRVTRIYGYYGQSPANT
jgi:hypothetical protein